MAYCFFRENVVMRYIILALLCFLQLVGDPLDLAIREVFMAPCQDDGEPLVGNVILFNWVNDLEAYDYEIDEPVLVAVDQEGGEVMRLTSGFTTSEGPYNAVDARRVAEEMREVGIHLNLAPVVDVGSSGRSYGMSAEEVIRCVRGVLDGFHAGGVATTLKHYPGLGSMQVDSHEVLPVVEDLDEGMRPFFQLASECIMVGHVQVPAIDLAPASLSKGVIDPLRKRFDGVILSDSLVMRAVSPNETFEEVAEAAVRAFLAGCDCMILARFSWGGWEELIPYVLAHFRKAVDDGVIPKARLKESVERILRLKERCGLEKVERLRESLEEAF